MVMCWMCNGQPVSSHSWMSRAISSSACSWPAEHAEARGNDALVDLAVADKAVILAVRHENLAEHLAVIHGATHHAGVLHALAVVGEGNGAMGYHVAHFGDDLALQTVGDGARRVHAALANLSSAALHVFDNRAIVGNGIGIGHGANAREAAMGSRARAARDVLFELIAGFAQMHMHVDKAGHEYLARKVFHLGAFGGNALAHLGDFAIFDQHVAHAVELNLGIDNAGVLKQHCHYSAPPKSRYSTAMRTQMPA